LSAASFFYAPVLPALNCAELIEITGQKASAFLVPAFPVSLLGIEGSSFKMLDRCSRLEGSVIDFGCEFLVIRRNDWRCGEESDEENNREPER